MTQKGKVLLMTVGVFCAATIAALILETMSLNKGASVSVKNLPQPIELRVNKSSIPVDKLTELHVQAVSETDQTDSRLRLRLEEMEIDQEVTFAELKEGVICKAMPSKIGVFELEVMQGDLRRGSVSIAAHREKTLSKGNIRYELRRADRPRATEAGGIFIDLYVVASLDGKLSAPLGQPRARIFERAKDEKKKATTDETVLFDGARTRNVYIRLQPDTDLSFGAELIQGEKKTLLNSVQVSWASEGPRLTIVPQAIRKEAYATAKTPCKVHLQLEYDGVRVAPASYTINPKISSDVQIQPEQITIGSDGFVVCDATSIEPGTATIDFHGPSSQSASIGVRFKSVWWFHMIATIAGVCVGLLFLFFSSASADLAKTTRYWWRIVACAVMSAFGGFFLSLALVHGFFVNVTLTEILLTYSGSIIIGIIGGLIGEGIVKFVFSPFFPQA